MIDLPGPWLRLSLTTSATPQSSLPLIKSHSSTLSFLLFVLADSDIPSLPGFTSHNPMILPVSSYRRVHKALLSLTDR